MELLFVSSFWLRVGQGWRGLVGRTNGGMIVHLGVVLIAVALAASNAYVRQETFELTPGETAELSGHTFTFLGTEVVEFSNRVERQAAVRVDGEQVYEPAIAIYDFAGRLIGIPSVRSTLRDDVALSIGEMSDDGQTIFLRVTIQPLIVWLWIGGFVMAAGTLLAVVPGNRRSPTAPVSAPVNALQRSGKQ